MKGMGYRTIKTAVGAGLAIWIASLFQLEFATFSAIIVIMCIEKTRKKTFITMKEKFFASLLSLVFGALFFELLGYNPLVFALFILLFIPLLVRIKMQDGFVTSMVVVLHVYTVNQASWAMFLNELAIISIGMGLAFFVNSFMPSFKTDVEKYKKQIESKFQTILYEFSAGLVNHNRTWDGKELMEVERLINQAKSIAVQDVENHLLRKEDKNYYYLEMRENQLELLNHIVKIVAIVSATPLYVRQKEMCAQFLEDLSENVHSGDTTERSLEELAQLKSAIREMELPQTREEFEVRANLFYLLYEMENYLNIKRKLFAARKKKMLPIKK